MKLTRHILFATAMVLPLAATAAEFTMPDGAELVSEQHDGVTSQRLAIAPFDGNEVPAIWAEGDRRMQAWQANLGGRTTLQVLQPLREQLVSEGFDVLFECRDVECGGFDFRYAQELLPEPDMHVDLGNYRFLSAQRMTEDGTPEYIALMVSANRSREFVHVTRLGPEEPEALVPVVTATKSDPVAAIEAQASEDLGESLSAAGVAVLGDLSFETGSSDLEDRDFPSLTELADLLNEKPGMRVSLVGHTDTKGSMEANFRLSKARAQSVRRLLIELYDVSPSQVDAQGVGYLAPVASNASEDGREQNRRVEVVLVSNE